MKVMAIPFLVHLAVDIRGGGEEPEEAEVSERLNDREETFAISAALMSFLGEIVSRMYENRRDRPG